MAPATKKRPPLETEPGEGKRHELKESPDEEIREGSEEEEGENYSSKRHSRKRSSKGAKRTKAPMDSDCGCGGKKGASCDGDCGMKKGRNDALTPQEYLAACELGIQNRSRTYIRARLDAMTITPASLRNDLKCGNGSISPGEKCTKGAASKAKGPGRIEREGWYGTRGVGGGDPFSYKKMARRGAVINAAGVGAMGALAGAAAMGGGARGALLGAGLGAAFGAVSGAAGGALQAGVNRATSRAAKRRRMTKEFEASITPAYQKKRARLQASGDRKAVREHDMKTAMQLARGYDDIQKRTKGRYGADSIWAAGFTPDSAQLAI